MTIRAMKFTPQVLLGAPRRSAGVPNQDGTHVLHTISTYDFEKHSKTTEVRVLNTKTNESQQLALSDEATDFVWLDNKTFAFLQSEKDSSTSLIVADIEELLTDTSKESSGQHVAGTIAAPAGNLKVAKLGDGEYAVVVSAEATPDGQLYNPEKAKKTQSTGKLFTGLFVRHWDHYTSSETNSLWYGKLSKSKDGKFSLSKLTNALKGTKLESPIRPFGGTDTFDVGKAGILFVAKDPELNPALNTKCNVYLIRIDSWAQEANVSKPLQVVIDGYEGASTSPVFSSDGRKAAFLSMKRPGYEADYNMVFTMHRLEGPRLEASAMSTNSSKLWWNRSPSSLVWSADSERLFAVAEDEGYARLFSIHDNAAHAVTKHAFVGDVRPLSGGKFFISGSSLVDNSFYSIIDPSITPSGMQTPEIWNHSNSDSGSKFGLKKSQISSIWTPASNGNINEKVHSWVFTPSNFDSSKKYPVAYLIHGGPQGSWGDSWSTRWNQAVFAEQGFIVVAPNVTGSTGYGQEFTDAINQNWGGDPYQDIVNVFDFVGENMPEADNDRAVALGASYGGYMMNWIQGHPLGRKFRALVCHDGIFSSANLLSTEELYFPFHDLGGTPWSSSTKSTPFTTSSTSAWRRWDPSEHLSNWATPQLVIHNSKDYRLPISEGLAAFNVLQARGVDSQFLTFPDENHFVLKPENSLVWHKTVLNWIRKHVGMSPFAEEEEASVEFFGGERSEDAEVADMMAQGKPET